VLNSVFARLEEIVTSPTMPAPVRKKLLQAEMTGYQELRDKILKRRASVQPSPAGQAAAPASAAPAPGAAAPPETLAQAVEELKAFIRSELKTLKEELRVSARRP
jgi:DNA replication initiation complex subunit (GINS family)